MRFVQIALLHVTEVEVMSFGSDESTEAAFAITAGFIQ
jgi:hypothetical protein